MCGRKSNNNLCAVCESPNAISQFGAITCRACGAFFRRLALNDRQYDCDCEIRLRGKPESEIARKRRIANCRGCRLRRCLGAGMTREGCKNGSMQYFQSSEDAYGINFTRKLLEIEAKARRIYFNVVGFPAQTLSHFESLEQLLQCNDNLLAHSEDYPAIKLEPFDKERFEEIITKAGLWSYEPCTFIKHLLISINIAKILPVFSRLDLPDKVAAVNVFVLSATNFIERYHSMRCNAEAGMIENINYPLFLLYTKSTNSDEPIIRNLAEAVFNLPMRNFLQTFPSREEFVLILALLFTNSANPALSENGQRIMNEESEKCAKTLLRLQQRQFGEQGGAIRYSECLQLLWNTIYTTQKHKELIVYIDTVYEQGKFEAVMPKILAPLVIGRKNAIEIDVKY